MAPRISVVGPRYCNRKKKVVALVPLANGAIAVANDKRRINFKAEELHRDLGRDPWRLRDAAGNPLVTLIPKFLTTHGRWEVFKGDSQNRRDLIFTAKKHSIVNRRTNLDVFLAKNTAEKVPDFKVEGSFSGKSYTIYAGEVIIAQLEKPNSRNVDDILQMDNNFVLKVKPNVDYIFIVILSLILKKIRPKFKFTIEMVVSSLSTAISLIML